MPPSLSMQLTAASHTWLSRNRKIKSHFSHWWRAASLTLVLAAAGVVLSSLIWAWGNLQYINLCYQISQAQETQKQHLELNRKLKIELANLTATSRLEKLAVENYGMASPQPHQVVILHE